MQQSERSRMLGEMPMKRLVPKISVPIMISMIVQALYNVVDSIFVSRFNPHALTAVSLAFPIQMLMGSLAVGMGVGISSLLSRKLGAGQRDEARRAAWNGFLIEASGSLLFMIIGLTLIGPIMGMLASDQLANVDNIREMGIGYLSIVTTFSQGIFMAMLFERMLQSTGSTVLSMATQLAGALTNIILDPIMIFGLLGCPSFGVRGAAIATVIGQFVSGGLGFVLNQTRNAELRLSLRDFAVDGALIGGILTVGFPSAVMQAIGSVMNIGMNGLLSGFEQGNAAVNVLNVYFKLQSFVFMPVFGLGSGMIAIVGYNYGARNRQRVYDAIRVCLTWAGSIMLAGMICFQIFPSALMSVFQSEAEPELTRQMHDIGIVALRAISLCFIPAAIGIVLSNVFQAVGRGVYSMIMSICRQLLVLLPVAWLLKATFGTVDAVWWCFLIAEGVSLALCLLLFRKCDREMLRSLDQSARPLTNE